MELIYIMDKCKLYYFPYAGASANTFQRLSAKFPQEIEFICYDYPGHGERVFEEFEKSVSGICEDMYRLILQDNKENIPFFLGGHCLGAIVAYELCHIILERNEMKLPEIVFISGHASPDKIVLENLIEKSDFELMKYLNEQGAIDEKMLNPETFNLVSGFYVAPIKADAKVYDSYCGNKLDCKINTNFVIFYGDKDWKCPEEEVIRWKEFVNGRIEFIKFHDNHYFVNSMQSKYAEEIIARINELNFKIKF